MMLRDVMTHAVTVEQEFKKKTKAQQSNARLLLLMIVMIPLLALSLYSWIARPEFIWGRRALALPVVEQDANLRMAMFLLGMRLDAYREETGAYPPSLDEVGERAPGITYTLVTDSTFQLSGMAGSHEVVFLSEGNAEEFLGRTKDVIQTRRKR
jgi:hypothetical protein